MHVYLCPIYLKNSAKRLGERLGLIDNKSDIQDVSIETILH